MREFLKFKHLTMVWSLFLLFCGITVLQAGNTGKISGRVTDKQTGEPLIGVNVVVEGSQLGAATDEDGFYFILQVPPGNHNLIFSYIGYHNLTVKEVRVKVDLTTNINVKLESASVQGPTVEVFAEQEMVQRDVTSTRKISSREDLQNAPGVESTEDFFKMQGGVITTPPQELQFGEGTSVAVRDESLQNIHVRGGRGGEILFMVDGMPVNSALYGGRSAVDLNVNDVQEIELLAGAFNAEYGNAQSGVINITTRSGGNKLKTSLEYKTDELGWIGATYSDQYANFRISGPELITQRLLPKFGLKLPGKMSFVLSLTGKMTNTRHNNHRYRDNLSILGLKFREKQNNDGKLFSKLSWKVSDNVRLHFDYTGNWDRHSNFNWAWKYYPDHMADYEKNTHNLTFGLNQTLSKNTFYNLNLGYLEVDLLRSWNGYNPADNWTFTKDGQAYDYWTYRNKFSGGEGSFFDASERGYKPPVIDQLTGFYTASSYQLPWNDETTKSFIMKGDVTSQIHPAHLMKTGFTIQYHDINVVDIPNAAYTLSDYGTALWDSAAVNRDVPKPDGPFPELGSTRLVYKAYPIEGGFYLQDKFELESMIINAGIRMDWLMYGSSIQTDKFKDTWHRATGLSTDWGWIKYKLSPRFGISFPISEKTVIFFSYGHFNQLPELQFFFRNPYSGVPTGNPHLDYVQTILYEFGFTRQLFNDFTIDVKSYAKDISHQTGVTQLREAEGQAVNIHDNTGYSRTRGLEFEINKRYSAHTSGKINYTIQWANGYSSSVFEEYIYSLNDFPKPIRERRLGYDVRHQVTLNASLISPKNRPISLFGFKLPDDWNLTVLYSFHSGQPYTPGTISEVQRQLLHNSAERPIITKTDVKFKKSFSLMDMKLAFTLDVYNLFDQNNITGNGFNVWTGEPFKYGDLQGNTNVYYDWYDMYALMTPYQFSEGRRAMFGLRFEF